MFNKIFSKQNKALLSELVRTDFKLRYQGSVLGYAWSLLRPLLMFAILYVVFVKFLRIGGDVPNYPIYLLMGIVMWQFFSDVTNQSLGAIVERGDLIRKIRIPRWIIIVSTSLSSIINLGFNLIVLLFFALLNNLDFLSSSAALPFIIIEIYLLALGVSLFLSAAFVRYRDMTYIWDIFIQAGFYVTPILYPLSVVVDVNIQKILMINPLAQAIQDARYAFVTHDTETMTTIFGNSSYRLIPIGIVFAILVWGILYFKKRAPYFAEDL
jgi:ABC-2 type transport system permease protein